MAKVRLELGAELDLLNKDEMASVLGHHGSWEREAAFGLRQQDLPVMAGTAAGGVLNLGADQPSGTQCGPKAGWYWAVHRISIDGLASGDAMKVYKDTRFVATITQASGSFATFGKNGLVLKDGESLLVKGTGLTATGLISVYGEATTTPGPLMWKLIS